MRRARRCKDELALLEGPKLIAEALASGLAFEAVLVTPPFLESAAARDLVPRFERPPLEVDERLFRAEADADSPRGIAALTRLPREALASFEPPPGGVVVYADGVQDPGNLGALARVAEACGVTALLLAPGCAHPNHPRALRASAGSLLRLRVVMAADSVRAVDRCYDALPHRWLALVPRDGDSVWRSELGGADALIVAVGAEGPGLSHTVRERADHRLTIPLQPPVESLNTTVAASVVLFEILRQRAG
ncbi:MAG: RNA methyltransferase [Acidobacteriota bacterium]